MYCMISIKNNNSNEISKYINNLSCDYNLDKKSIIKMFFNHLIKYHIDLISRDVLLFMENLLHSNVSETDLFVNYFILKIGLLLE